MLEHSRALTKKPVPDSESGDSDSDGAGDDMKETKHGKGSQVGGSSGKINPWLAWGGTRGKSKKLSNNQDYDDSDDDEKESIYRKPEVLVNKEAMEEDRLNRKEENKKIKQKKKLNMLKSDSKHSEDTEVFDLSVSDLKRNSSQGSKKLQKSIDDIFDKALVKKSKDKKSKKSKKKKIGETKSKLKKNLSDVWLEEKWSEDDDDDDDDDDNDNDDFPREPETKNDILEQDHEESEQAEESSGLKLSLTRKRTLEEMNEEWSEDEAEPVSKVTKKEKEEMKNEKPKKVLLKPEKVLTEKHISQVEVSPVNNKLGNRIILIHIKERALL